MAFDYIDDTSLPEDFFDHITKKEREKYQLTFVKNNPVLAEFLKKQRINYHKIDWKSAYYSIKTGNKIKELPINIDEVSHGYLPVSSDIYRTDSGFGYINLDVLNASKNRDSILGEKGSNRSVSTLEKSRLTKVYLFKTPGKDPTIMFRDYLSKGRLFFKEQLSSSNIEDFERFIDYYLSSKITQEEKRDFLTYLGKMLRDKHDPFLKNTPPFSKEPATRDYYIEQKQNNFAQKIPEGWVKQNFKGFFASDKDLADSAKNFIATFDRESQLKKEQEELNTWRHPIERQIANGVFQYNLHKGVVTQEKIAGQNVYTNKTRSGTFNYLGITEAVNYYYGIDYSNISDYRAMERGTRIHDYIDRAIKNKSFRAEMSYRDIERIAEFKVSTRTQKQHAEDVAYIEANMSRLNKEMTYANRILDYINTSFPKAQGWEIKSEYTVSDYMNYASSIDILCINKRTKEAVILDLKTGKVRENAVNAQTGIYRHFLRNESRFRDYDISLGAISLDGKTSQVKVLPLNGITEDQAHNILYPDSAFNSKSIWYNKNTTSLPVNPGYGVKKKVTVEKFSPDSMLVSPLDNRVLSDMFHKQKGKGIGDIVFFDIETLPLANGRTTLRSFAVLSMTAHKDASGLQLKYNGELDTLGNINSKTLNERAFLADEKYTDETIGMLSYKAKRALETNNLSDTAVKAFEAAHGREARKATSKDILDLMDSFAGKVVVGHNELGFDFAKLFEIGRWLAKEEGGADAYSAFDAAFKEKIKKVSIIDTYELAKELRHKAPNSFAKITVKDLLKKLSPKDADKISFHQSSADVAATAKIFEKLLNGLPSQEQDILLKIIKDTRVKPISGKEIPRYTITSKFETDGKISEAGVDEGPIGFDLHRTTHWILGEPKEIEGERYVRFDDSRKYDREYTETVANAIQKNQVILIPTPDGKGYYLSTPEEYEAATIWSYDDYTNIEKKFFKTLRKHGRRIVSYDELPHNFEDELAWAEKREKWRGEDATKLTSTVFRFNSNELAGFNRIPNIALRQSFFSSYFNWIKRLGRANLSGKLVNIEGKKSVLDMMIEQYERNIYLQTLDTVILSKKGKRKGIIDMADSDILNGAEALEALKLQIEAMAKQIKELSKTGSSNLETILSMKEGLNFFDSVSRLDSAFLSDLANSEDVRLGYLKDLGFKGDTLANMNHLLGVAAARSLSARNTKFDTDIFKWELLKDVPEDFKKLYRFDYIRAYKDNPRLANSVMSYLKNATEIAKTYGFGPETYQHIYDTVGNAFSTSTILTADDVLSVVPTGKMLDEEAAKSNWRNYMGSLTAEELNSPDLENAKTMYKYRLLNEAKHIDATSSNISVGTEIAARQVLEKRNKEKALRREEAQRYIDHNIMMPGDADKLLKATKSQKEYAEALGEVSERTAKLNTLLKGTVHSLASIPFYNPDQLFSAGYHQISNIHRSLNGVIPSFLNTSITKMLMGGVQDYELGWQKWKYGIKSAMPAFSLVGSAMGAMAGAPFGAGVQGAMLGGQAATGLAAWGTQLIGNRYERAINETGLFFSSRFNKMGAMIAPAIAALNLFTKALKLASVPLLAGLGSGLYMYKRALNNMGTLDTPLYNLTGINYGMGYNQLSRLDYTLGMKRGTTNNIIEGVEFAKQGLLSLGRYDKNKLVSSALLGIFSEAYMNPGDGASNYAAMTSKLYENYQNSKNKGRFMYLLNEYNPELAKQLQVRTEYESFLASDRGIPYRNRHYYYNDINRDQRNEFRAITGIQSSFGESLQNSFMKIAAALYNWKGFDFMNKYTSIVGNAADAFAGGKINEGFKIIGDGIIDFIDNLGKTWDEVKQKLGISGLKDTILTYGNIIYHEIKLKLIDLGLFVTDIFEKIKDPAKGFFMMLYEQFKKLFDFVGSIRLDIDMKRVLKGDVGGFQFKVGYGSQEDPSYSHEDTWQKMETYGKVAWTFGTHGAANRLWKAYGVDPVQFYKDPNIRNNETFRYMENAYNEIAYVLEAMQRAGYDVNSVEDLDKFLTNAQVDSPFNHLNTDIVKSVAWKMKIEPASSKLSLFEDALSSVLSSLEIKDPASVVQNKLEEAKKKETKVILELKNDQGKTEQHELIGNQTGIIQVFGPNWKWGVR